MSPNVSHTTSTGTIFLRRISEVDCGLFDPALGILGQSWHVDLEITGTTDENGFVYDFSKLKTLVRQALKSTVDHALLIPVMSKAVEFCHGAEGEAWSMESQLCRHAEKFRWTYTCPSGAVFPLRTVNLSQETIAQEITRTIVRRLPETITDVKLWLREEELDPTEASYRYTHGITGHDGRCQRLFHGHKCCLEIHVGDERRPDLEHYVARDVLGAHVHMASPSQVKSGDVEIGMRGPDNRPVVLSYRTSEGLYEATLPASRVFIIEGETSVESITRQLATIVAAREKGSQKVRVRCYEGIDKGAVVEL